MADQVLYEYQHLFKPSAYRNAEVAKAVRRRLDELEDVYKFGLKDTKTIAQSTHLTREGKVDAYKKAGAEVTSLLKPIENVVSAYGDRIREARDVINPRPHDRNDLAWQLEKQEVRMYLRGLDPAIRDQFILVAIERGDLLVLEAIKYSPIPNEFGAQELIDKITARQIELQHPDASEEIREMERAQGEVQSALASVRAELARRGLKMDAEPLTEADAA